MWRYTAENSRRRSKCGWKLHVSATILNAPTVLDRIAPFLIARGASFKAPRSLDEVGNLNSGLNYQYSQIGKIITVYPKTDDEAVFLAGHLHCLTKDLSGPAIPFDLRFADTGNVYYRYGAFEHLELSRNGRKISAVYAPDGNLVPDIREQAKPDWAADPFAAHKPKSNSPKQSAPTSIRVISVLAQRGKGGVYVALDLRSQTPKLCLLKEGRKNGEMTWDGRDGACRVRNEKRVLSQLSAVGVEVPRLLSSFELGGNYYLLMEFLDGRTLHDQLLSRTRRMTIAQVLDYGIQLAKFIQQMHQAGWAWRDCKPKNIIVTRDGRLVPIDFEGAAPIHRPDPMRWGTPGFTAPKTITGEVGNGMADDAYAFGSIMFLLLTGRIYDPSQASSIDDLRRHVPRRLSKLVNSLLAAETGARISATDALPILQRLKRPRLARSRA